MSREDNVAVFEDTRRQCKENEILKKAIRQATGDQYVLYEDDVVGDFPALCCCGWRPDMSVPDYVFGI